MDQKIKKPVPGSTNSYGWGTKSTYISKCETVELTYIKGVLVKVRVNPEDQVSYEGIRHHIELYASELNGRYFAKVPSPTFMRHFPEVNLLKGLIFILLVALLGLVSNCSFIALIQGKILWAVICAIVFTVLVSILFWRNGRK